MWGLIVFFSASHVFIDRFKANVFDKKVPCFVAFIVDQLMHVVVLCVVLLFDFSWRAPGPSHTWCPVYNDTKAVIFVAAYLAVTFAGTYFWDTFKRSYLPSLAGKETARMINYGFFERGVMMAVFCFSPARFFLLFLILFFVDLRMRKRIGAFDFFFNCIFAGVGGLLMRIFVLPIH